MPGPNSDVTTVDGTLSFEGGVDSRKVTTIQSSQNPNGLARNQLAWMNNCSVRDGGVLPRGGWQYLGNPIHGGNVIYQGGWMYEPTNADPYLIVSLSGHIFKVNTTTGAATDLSTTFNLTNSATAPQAYFCQAEQFLIIQSGDGTTLPLFWDGAVLRRSKGITNTAVPPGTPGVNEIPAATAMDYYMGRLWYAQDRQYSAGDIVGGPSGTLAYRQKDSVLNVTENPLVVGGDGFTVPSNAGNIRALAHNGNLDSALGQGLLFIFTRKAVYSLKIPVTRTDWIAAGNNNQPQQNVVQLVNGAVSDRSVVAVNGDLFYQSLEPGIRSLISAIRYFQQWGNIQISANELRIMQFNDRALLHVASGITFDNRLLQTALPRQVAQGIVHDALVPLDFVPVSSFGAGLTPVWEGMYQGLQFFQLFTGNYGGRDRAFAVVLSTLDQSIQLWEISSNDRSDNGDNRITWNIETPAFTWGQEFGLKKLVSAEMWLDRLYGEAVITLEFRPDGDPCWKPWHKFKICSARNSCEDVINPICYPLTQYGEGYKSTLTMPRPPATCETMTGRPSNIAYQFQCRITVHGFLRLRGFLLHGEGVDRKLYAGITC